MLYFIPIETMEQRYTKMMNEVISPLVDKVIYPEFDYSWTIEKGQFLDINKTSIFKAKQLQMIAEMFYKWEVKDWDKFLVADIFFPWIESIRYMADLQDIHVEIFWYNHAGRADPTDFVQKLWEWSDVCEKWYMSICDYVFVWSNYHKDLIVKYFNMNENRVLVYWPARDLDWVENVCSNKNIKKEDFIIMPQRVAPEKWLTEFIEFAKNTDKKIIVTSSWNKVEWVEFPANVEYKTNLSKKEYYELLSKAKWYVSFAYQETFWYTLQEAIYYRCNILVPNRVCYPEMVPERNLYSNTSELLSKLDEEDMTVPMEYTEKWNKNYQRMIDFIKA